ncbi:MAG: carbohydrate kinase family protein, partial [Methanosarcinales archaeon]|nr:carbohydrate kinase family protein [Methanosarcinales archaeon]
ESFVSAIKVDAVDPTGAGDAYRAGFLLAYTKKYPLTVCGQIGSATASFVVERVGCQTNLPTWEMMQERHDAFYDERIK